VPRWPHGARRRVWRRREAGARHRRRNFESGHIHSGSGQFALRPGMGPSRCEWVSERDSVHTYRERESTTPSPFSPSKLIVGTARVAPSPARIAGAARDLMSGRHGRRRGRFRGRQIVRIHQTHLGAQPCGLVGSGDVVPSTAALPLWAAILGAALSGRLVGDADSCGRHAVVDIVRAALSRFWPRCGSTPSK